MDVALGTPTTAGLDQALEVLRGWQLPGTPFQLHPGDLGWSRRLGVEQSAAAVRTWSRDGRLLALGLLDGPGLLRLGIDPDAQHDHDLARRLAADVADPGRGVLPPGEAAVECPPGSLLHDLLGGLGWGLDEPWAVLRRDLADPVEASTLRVEPVGPGSLLTWTAVLRAAFDVPELTDEAARDRWDAMASGPASVDARFLLGHDQDDHAVAAVGAWSAGPGSDGVLEPMGVHPGHRGRGHGRSIVLAAAAALRDLGSAAAVVATPAVNVGGVATYVAAGFERLPDRRDRVRPTADVGR